MYGSIHLYAPIHMNGSIHLIDPIHQRRLSSCQNDTGLSPAPALTWPDVKLIGPSIVSDFFCLRVQFGVIKSPCRRWSSRCPQGGTSFFAITGDYEHFWGGGDKLSAGICCYMLDSICQMLFVANIPLDFYGTQLYVFCSYSCRCRWRLH